MKSAARCVLTINGGSSSIKIALFEAGRARRRILEGKIEGIGQPQGKFAMKGSEPTGNIQQPTSNVQHPMVSALGSSTPRQNPVLHSVEEKTVRGDTFSRAVNVPDHTAAVEVLMDWVQTRIADGSLAAVGHRVVHGGPKYWEPQRITAEMIEALHQLSPFDPEHLPEEILLAEAFHRRFPDLPQIACFDTAFHHDMPRVARLLPIPRRYDAKGVRRYGFHGLSCEYLMSELARVAGAEAANGRVVLAHLGNGASVTAVRGGRSIDTSMSFTPTAGLPMSTRSGDLDPGLGWYLSRAENVTAQQFHEMVNHESGLLGVSESSSDMRELLSREAQDVRAAEAVALFCYQTKKWICALAGALEGLDTLVFSGGIGENACEVRRRICAGLEFLGVAFDARQNAAGAEVISTKDSKVTVRVIRTDEEWIIAKTVGRVLGWKGEI